MLIPRLQEHSTFYSGGRGGCHLKGRYLVGLMRMTERFQKREMNAGWQRHEGREKQKGI